MLEDTLNQHGPDQSYMEPLSDDPFCFACHPGVPCFTQCCANLNLALTPYDVLRLKIRLEISSAEFLDNYTTDEIKNNCGLPVLMFKMKNDSRKTCPFLQPGGCTVYEDRPGACRLYPVGRAARFEHGKIREQFFLVKEPHCLGFLEKTEWTAQTWTEDQGLDSYNQMNRLWMAINQGIAKDSTPPSITADKVKMYYMACYNLDMFKKFVFESSLLKSFQIEKKRVSRLRTDETELLKFAFNWIAFAVFGKKTMKLKPSVLKAQAKRRR